MATLLFRVGLDAEALAAAGVDSGSVASLVAAVDDPMAQKPSGLAPADAALAQARRAEDDLERPVRSGLCTPQNAQADQSAEQDLEAAGCARGPARRHLRRWRAGPARGEEAGARHRSRQPPRQPPLAAARGLPRRRPHARGVGRPRRRARLRAGPRGVRRRPARRPDVAAPERRQAEPAVADALYKADTQLASVQTAWNAGVAD